MRGEISTSFATVSGSSLRLVRNFHKRVAISRSAMVAYNSSTGAKTVFFDFVPVMFIETSFIDYTTGFGKGRIKTAGASRCIPALPFFQQPAVIEQMRCFY